MQATMTEAETERFPALAEVERRHILAAMERFRGNKREAAKALGISHKTIYNKLNAYAARDEAERSGAESC
jgi:two-component system response regulator HydG